MTKPLLCRWRYLCTRAKRCWGVGVWWCTQYSRLLLKNRKSHWRWPAVGIGQHTSKIKVNDDLRVNSVVRC